MGTREDKALLLTKCQPRSKRSGLGFGPFDSKNTCILGKAGERLREWCRSSSILETADFSVGLVHGESS